MESYEKTIDYLPERVKAAFLCLPERIKKDTDEIRLRIGVVSIFACGRNIFFDASGKVCKPERAIRISEKELKEAVMLMCRGSMYSYDETIRQGFIPLPYGRAGICGETVSEGGKILRMGRITGVNLRIHRHIYGFERDIISLYKREGIKSTLIYSPPAMGKTTLLRGIAYALGRGEGIKTAKVGVADERREILLEGVDFGICDGVSGCAKASAIEVLTRVMSPEVIICDEITSADVESILNSHGTGVSLICSCHGESKEDLLKMPFVKRLADEGVFKILVRVYRGDGYFYECEAL